MEARERLLHLRQVRYWAAPPESAELPAALVCQLRAANVRLWPWRAIGIAERIACPRIPEAQHERGRIEEFLSADAAGLEDVCH